MKTHDVPIKINKKIITIVFVIIVLLGILVAALFLEKSEERKYTYTYEYIVVVGNATTDKEFEVLCPLPINGKGEPYTMIVQNLIIEGNASTSIASTSRGPALKISGNGLVKLRWYEKYSVLGENCNCFWNLSLLNASDTLWYTANVWIYSNTSDIVLDLTFNYSSSFKENRFTYAHSTYGQWFSYMAHGNLTAGWQQIPIECWRRVT